MDGGATKERKSGVASKGNEDRRRGQFEFDLIVEEKIDTDTIEQQEKVKRQAYCDRCLAHDFVNIISLYMCVVCEIYYCKKCFKLHNERNTSHMIIHVKSESRKNDGFDDFVNSMMKESEKERKKSLRKTNVCVCDYVDTKHKLDKKDEFLFNYGFTGYDKKWWVVCDFFVNSCIKVFSKGSNVLQRYIRLQYRPFDVTDIIVEKKTTEQDSASCSATAISGTDNKLDRKHLLAVTLPSKRLILIIDLGKTPAVINSKIYTGLKSLSIDFYDGNIYTCTKPYPGSHVYILSVEGVILKKFQTDIPYDLPYLTVLNGNIYMTDPNNDRVLCYNDEGQVLYEFTLGGLYPLGICVDRSENKVYICSRGHDKVYELESDLSRYKPVLDQTSFMLRPWAMCFYNDKLYVGHYFGSESGSHVTVVQLL